MGQMVYVLMSLEGRGKVLEWRPVAVVTDPGMAEEWMQGSERAGEVDWVPLEIDDIRDLHPGDRAPRFQPRKPMPGEEQMKGLREETEKTIDKMRQVIEQQAALIKKLQGSKAAAGDKVPPKPAGFENELFDASDIARYIEQWAIYDVDPEFVEEQFRDCHAVLRLLPIAQLTEGNPEHHKQSPANENKYQRMDIKTLPPILVSGGGIAPWSNNEVIDGNHRLRAAIKRGLTHLWSYVVNLDGEPNGDINE
jgi:hypothetical protein